MSLLLAVLFSAGLLGLFAYYKARTCLSFPHHSLTYRTPGPAQSRAHNDDAQLHTANPKVSLLATTPAYSFATTAVSRTPQRSFNIDKHATPLSVGWSAKSCATAFSIRSPVAGSVSVYSEDAENLDVEISDCDTMTARTAISIPRSPIGAAY